MKFPRATRRPCPGYSAVAEARIGALGGLQNYGGMRSHSQECRKLKPLFSVSGVSFVVDGRGDADPVASNDTAAGRQRNRRVSVVYTPKVG